MPHLKDTLTKSVERFSGALCTVPSAAIPQAFAASGVDCVIIDLEHGAVD